MKHQNTWQIISFGFWMLAGLAHAQDIPKFDLEHTAILITDPQNEFLHPDGKLYGLIKENLKELNTIENIEKLMKISKKKGITLAVDPLVYSAQDQGWQNAGVLQKQLLNMQALTSNQEENSSGLSGADYYRPFLPYIEDGKTLKIAPHKMYGPESNDLIYQLRARNIHTVILGGLVANLCVDSHMRTLMENGFSVYVVKDAVAAPGEAAYQAALTNYGMIANGVFTTKQVLQAFGI